MLLLGAGPRALLLQIAHPGGRGRRRRAQRLPGRSVGAAPGDAAELPDDRLRDDDRGTGGDPAPERAPPIDPRRRLRRPRPRPLALGPRHARRHDDRRLRRLDRAAAARRPRALLRRDAADRAGVRGPGRPASRRSRVVRGVRRRDARARRARPRLAGRPRARVARPEPAARAGAAAARRPAARVVRVDAVAVDRAAAGVRAIRVRPPLGTARAGA